MDDKSAVESLRLLGLTEYEARVYMALNSIGTGIVADIHAASGVPRSAIYGTLSLLDEKGLIEVEHGKPMRYRGVEPAKAIGKLQRAIEEKSDRVSAFLEKARENGGSIEAPGSVWTLRGEENRYNKLYDMVLSAEHDIVLVSTVQWISGDSNPLRSKVISEMGKKLEAGIRIRLICMDPAQARLVKSLSPATELRVLDPAKPSSQMGIKGDVWLVDGREALIIAQDEPAKGCNSGNLTAVYTRMESLLSVFRHFIEVEWDSALPV